jgi:hypothetical protein
LSPGTGRDQDIWQDDLKALAVVMETAKSYDEEFRDEEEEEEKVIQFPYIPAENLTYDDFRVGLDWIQHLLRGTSTEPYRIGVVGSDATGKSTFLKKLLGLSFHAVRRGVTTAVPIEMCRDDGVFSATICYKRRSDLRADLENYLHAARDDIMSTFCQEMKSRVLSHFLDLPNPRLLSSGTDFPSPTLNNLETLWPYLDRDPLTIECNSREELVIAIDQHFEAAVVKKVAIKGPFETIPMGVILVDIPSVENVGLAASFMSSLDEVWITTQASVLYTFDANRQILKRILEFDRIRIGFVITDSENLFNSLGEENTEAVEKASQILRANLRNAYSSGPLSNLAIAQRVFQMKCPGISEALVADYFARFPFPSEEALSQFVTSLDAASQAVIYDFTDRLSVRSFTFDDLPADCQAEIDASIRQLDIGFTDLGAERTLGLEKWIRRIKAIATARTDKLREQLKVLRQMVEQNTIEDQEEDFTSRDPSHSRPPASRRRFSEETVAFLRGILAYEDPFPSQLSDKEQRKVEENNETEAWIAQTWKDLLRDVANMHPLPASAIPKVDTNRKETLLHESSMKLLSWSMNQLEMNESFKDAMLERETTEIVAVACVGEARAGKVFLSSPHLPDPCRRVP